MPITSSYELPPSLRAKAAAEVGLQQGRAKIADDAQGDLLRLFQIGVQADLQQQGINRQAYDNQQARQLRQQELQYNASQNAMQADAAARHDQALIQARAQEAEQNRAAAQAEEAAKRQAKLDEMNEKDRREVERLESGKRWVQQKVASGEWTPEQGQQAVTQLEAKQAGIEATALPKPPQPDVRSEGKNRINYNHETGFAEILQPDGKITLEPLPKPEAPKAEPKPVGPTPSDIAKLRRDAYEVLTVESQDSGGYTVKTRPKPEEVQKYIDDALGDWKKHGGQQDQAAAPAAAPAVAAPSYADQKTEENRRRAMAGQVWFSEQWGRQVTGEEVLAAAEQNGVSPDDVLAQIGARSTALGSQPIQVGKPINVMLNGQQAPVTVESIQPDGSIIASTGTGVALRVNPQDGTATVDPSLTIHHKGDEDLPRPTTQSAYDALDEGQIYIGRDGLKHRKSKA